MFSVAGAESKLGIVVIRGSSHDVSVGERLMGFFKRLAKGTKETDIIFLNLNNRG